MTIWLPKTVADEMKMEEANKAREDWYASHSRCPDCGSSEQEKTCIGVITVPGRAFFDYRNRATCLGCGRSGKVSELTCE